MLLGTKRCFRKTFSCTLVHTSVLSVVFFKNLPLTNHARACGGISAAPVSRCGVETAEADSAEREREKSEDDWSIPLAAAERGRRGT